jgi:Ca-activated chloride channel family protein
MGRHADLSPARRRIAPAVLIAAAVTVALIGGLVWWVSAPAAQCTQRRTVSVAVAPEIGSLVSRLLAAPRPLGGGICAVARVSAQPPLQTVADFGALDAAAHPRIWVPDSSIWAGRAGRTPLAAAGTLASSPVVLASSRAAVDELGWGTKAPSWGSALTAGHAISLPDLAGSARGLSALAAVRASLGGTTAADDAVVRAVLAAGRNSVPISADDALASGAKGRADAPLVPVSEQQVFAADHSAAAGQLAAVYPSDGSPELDYPILRVGSPPSADRAAVTAVVATLTSAQARTAVRAAGFRTADGAAPPGAGLATGISATIPRQLRIDPQDVVGLLARLSSLAAPSRLLAVFDVSTSMRSPVGSGSRITLARDAAKNALALFPDTSAIGLWIFARQLHGAEDWNPLLPIRTLSAPVGGTTQRDALRAQLDGLPGRLSPGGTGLYDTTLAAVRAAKADYVPASVSSVVIVTDGRDEDVGSIGLPNLVITLRAELDPHRPVKVIGIGIGPDADLGALQEIASATGGSAYSAVNPADLQSVLFDALRRRG